MAAYIPVTDVGFLIIATLNPAPLAKYYESAEIRADAR
jgi:hypothetical protein